MRLPRWIETITWLVGLVLLVSYGAARGWAEYARLEGIHTFRQIRINSPAGLRDLPLLTQRPAFAADLSLWSDARIRAFRQVAQREAPEGVLRIPALTLEVPVYGSTSETDLNRGAGHIEGTASFEAFGNVGIAAHRDGFFRKLKDLHQGQLIYLDTRSRTQRFRVVDIRVVNPTEVEVLAPTATPSITLVTCYPFYFVGSAPQRFVVRAEIDEGDRAGSFSRPAMPSTQE